MSNLVDYNRESLSLCKDMKYIQKCLFFGVFFIVMFEIISMKELPGKLHF